MVLVDTSIRVDMLRDPERSRMLIARIEANAFQAARDEGMNVVELSAEEVAAWRKGADPVVEQYKASAGALGEKLLKAAEELRGTN